MMKQFLLPLRFFVFVASTLLLLPRWTVVMALALPSLQVPHPPMTPSECLQNLSEECQDIQDWDVYGDFDKKASDSFIKDFEAELAQEFGKEDAVFMPSGVMAQSIALLIHSRKSPSQPQKTSFVCHATSHLLLHEQEGFQELCGLQAISLPIDDNKEPGIGLHASPLLYRHIQEATDQLNDVSTLLLELPHRELGGKITPWEDILQLQQFCQQRGIAFHCDGARIFEATTAYQKSPAELAEPFDSIYVSFYKGLGGMSGAMLMGSKDFCDQARIWLRRFGGNLYTLLPYAVSGRSGYRKYWKQQQSDDKRSLLSFEEKRDKLVRIAKALMEQEQVRQVLTLEPSIPQVNMMHVYLRPELEVCNHIRYQVQQSLGISPFHRIRAIDKDELAYAEGYRCKLEVSVGQANGSVPDQTWLQAWTEFAMMAAPEVCPSAKEMS